MRAKISGRSWPASGNAENIETARKHNCSVRFIETSPLMLHPGVLPRPRIFCEFCFVFVFGFKDEFARRLYNVGPFVAIFRRMNADVTKSAFRPIIKGNLRQIPKLYSGNSRQSVRQRNQSDNGMSWSVL